MLEKAQSTTNPFAPKDSSFFDTLLATAFIRCWHILLFFGLWSAAVSLISHNVYDLAIQPTLLTVFGTVLGFVISYRTTSAFERYNEGRRLFSQIILGSRTFGRTVWFHVPDIISKSETVTLSEQRARSTIEKKTVINLLEGFSVAVKHYLRGEGGIYYNDLYHLVKFLPAYALPPGMPPVRHDKEETEEKAETTHQISALPMRASASQSHRDAASTIRIPGDGLQPPLLAPVYNMGRRDTIDSPKLRTGVGFLLPRDEEEKELLPASAAPKYHALDVFPFSFIVGFLTRKGQRMGGRKAAKLRAKLLARRTISHNLPLEISFYLSSYVSKLQIRQSVDAPTLNTLFTSLNQLVDALTGLERVLTTPIPFSYSFHLWLVTTIYCLTLPFQLWQPLGWINIPATVIAAFVFFGFLVAGEEIEDPFGYDKNDLDLDHFTHNIIRTELRALTSADAPDPEEWAFSPENNVLFASGKNDRRVTPEEWVRKGYSKMYEAMAVAA